MPTMIPINRRADAMFEQIAQHVDFTNKVVMDIGSGYCDLAMKAVDAGAAKVLCLEKVPSVFDQALRKISDTKYGAYIELLNIDAEDLIQSLADSYRVDIAFCTSVLPYLRSPQMMIKWMSNHTDVSIIEVQYMGDGPGDDMLIEGDAMMDAHLRYYGKPNWSSKKRVKKIGETTLDIRPAKRSIWLCRSAL